MVALLCCRMGTIFRSLGLSVGVALKHSVEPEQTQAAFDADITYVTASDLAFAYLSDNTYVESLEQLARPLWPCLPVTTSSSVWCHVVPSMPVHPSLLCQGWKLAMTDCETPMPPHKRELGSHVDSHALFEQHACILTFSSIAPSKFALFMPVSRVWSLH